MLSLFTKSSKALTSSYLPLSSHAGQMPAIFPLDSCSHQYLPRALLISVVGVSLVPYCPCCVIPWFRPFKDPACDPEKERDLQCSALSDLFPHYQLFHYLSGLVLVLLIPFHLHLPLCYSLNVTARGLLWVLYKGYTHYFRLSLCRYQHS